MKSSKENLRDIMRTAWQFFKQTGSSFSLCLKKAWDNFKLKQKMSSGIVRFYFQKTNGEMREAWGTLQGVEEKIKGTNKPKNSTVQVYWDTESNAFRSFKKFNLLSF